MFARPGRPAFLRLAILLVTLSGASEIARAQAPQCDAWRGELARLERSGGGNPRAAQSAQRVGAELARAQQVYSSLQCGGSWVFQQPPPQCFALRGQIGQLRAQLGSLEAAGGGSENRRRALMAAIEDNCRPGVYRTQPIAPQPQQPQQPRTLFEALFGVPDRPPPPPHGMPLTDGILLDEEARGPSWGSGRPVCVRTCDGYFFPLANSPGGRESQSDMCRALCPAAETEVFYMSGDGNIENASSRTGSSYSSLPNAGRYLRQFDPSCGCRKQGQSWAQALADAEDMLERRRGDVFVTEQRAEEMSRARTAPTTPTRAQTARQRQQQAAGPVAPAAEQAADAAAARALDEAGRSAPTASTESSGIGPRNLGTGTVAAGQGERREVTNAAGERRTVRIVAPALSPVIQ
jgi:hypothetical protein